MLPRKIVLVKILLKKGRTRSGVPFLRKEELKKIVLKRLSNWICVINSWFVTEWLRAEESGGRINSMRLKQILGLSM